MPNLPRPIRAWICRRLARRAANALARALDGCTEGGRIQALLAQKAPAPRLPEAWPAHCRLSVQTVLDDFRCRHALAICLGCAERLVFALDLPDLPRLRLWVGRDWHAEGDGSSAFVIVSMPLRR